MKKCFFPEHDFAITEKENKEANPCLSVSITNLRKLLGKAKRETKMTREEMKYVNKEISVNNVLTK